MRILVDTNILLRIAQPSSADHTVSARATARLVTDLWTLCIVPQVLYEFWVVITRPIEVNGLGMTVEAAAQSVERLLSRYVLLRDERGVFDLWRTLVAEYSIRGKSAHDARIVAAMKRHGLVCILTLNDADFRRFPELQVVTPKDAVAGTLPLLESDGE